MQKCWKLIRIKQNNSHCLAFKKVSVVGDNHFRYENSMKICFIIIFSEWNKWMEFFVVVSVAMCLPICFYLENLLSENLRIIFDLCAKFAQLFVQMRLSGQIEPPPTLHYNNLPQNKRLAPLLQEIRLTTHLETIKSNFAARLLSWYILTCAYAVTDLTYPTVGWVHIVEAVCP